MRGILLLQASMRLKLRYLILRNSHLNAWGVLIVRWSSSRYFQTTTVKLLWLKMIARLISTHNTEHTTKPEYLIILGIWNTIHTMPTFAYQHQLTKFIDLPLRKASFLLPSILILSSTPCTLTNNLMSLFVEGTSYKCGILGKGREFVNFKRLVLYPMLNVTIQA